MLPHGAFCPNLRADTQRDAEAPMGDPNPYRLGNEIYPCPDVRARNVYLVKPEPSLPNKSEPFDLICKQL